MGIKDVDITAYRLCLIVSVLYFILAVHLRTSLIGYLFISTYIEKNKRTNATRQQKRFLLFHVP